MKKLMLTLAGAMALSFTANAVALFSDNETWFDGGIEEGWPEKAKNGGWSNTNGTTYAESKLNVSALAETPLTFTADVAKVTADYKATISSTVGFTAFAELPTVPTDAKAGVIAHTNGYFYVLADNGSGNAWQKTAIEASEEAVVDVTFLDPTNVVYTIGGAPVTNKVAKAERIQNVCVSGDGTLADLKATAEQKAVMFTIADAVHTTKEVTGAELVEGTTYKALPGAEVTVTYTADFGYFFADGSKTYIVDAEAGQGITIEVKVDRVVAAAKIGDDKDYFTLTNALAEAKSGDTVTLLKDIETAEKAAFTIAKNITLDFDAYTVKKTVPNDWVFAIAKDATVIFKGTTGGVHSEPGKDNPTSPASMIQVLGNLTIEGGVYETDYTCVKVDEGTGFSGECTIKGGTFNVIATTYTGASFAVQNWGACTITAGTFSGKVAGCAYNGINTGTSMLTIDGGAFTPNNAFLYMHSATDTAVPIVKALTTLGMGAAQISKAPEGYVVQTLTEGDYTVYTLVKPIDPTKDEKIKCDTEAEAVIAAALINNNLQESIKAPDALSDADKTSYRNMFQATVDGKVVTIGLTETAEDAVQKDVNTNTVTESVAAALIEPTAESVTIDANVPGLYYWIEGAEAVGFEMPTNGPAAMATAKGSLELVKPGKAGTGAQQFYKVAAGVKDPNPEPVKK